MVTSEFTLDAAIRSKLGRRATEPLATKFQSAIDLLGGPATEFGSDGRIQCKLRCDRPSQHCWQCSALPQEVLDLINKCDKISKSHAKHFH
ncbi:hypothetical protein PCANC_15859 [Puccinia coronata f. sp. avenae]|uniref:Uncharacterized protein n=1 Tax=Puccinia coronata f. sp. avenae TaxID=200324 RepID=A0A2N5UPM1_9BASI|nr:hypothetical protein PCANC_15859 [Puccinia coronata f. sp. avenae]